MQETKQESDTAWTYLPVPDLNPVQEELQKRRGMLESLKSAKITLNECNIKIKKTRRMKLHIKLTQEQTLHFEKVAEVFKGAGIQGDDEIAATIFMAGVAAYIKKISDSIKELESMEKLSNEREAKELEASIKNDDISEETKING